MTKKASNNHLEERVRLTFNAFNNELRAVIDGFLLEDDIFLTQTELWHKLSQLIPKNITGKKSRVIERHLKHGLPKAKLQYFVDESKNPVSWKKSYGLVPHHDDIARFLLYMTAIKFPMSLTNLLGKSQADGPYTTVKVLELVVNKNVHTVRGLEKRLKLSTQQIIAKIKKMEKIGLLTYQTFYSDTGKGKIKYRRNPDYNGEAKVDNTFKYPILTAKVIDVLNRDPAKLYSVGDLNKHKRLQEYNPSTISGVLRILQKKRIVKSNENWESQVKLSHVQETIVGTEFYDIVIEPIIKLLKYGRGIKTIKRKALWPENLSKVAELYLNFKSS